MTANTGVSRGGPILLYVRLCDPEEEEPLMTASTPFHPWGGQ